MPEAKNTPKSSSRKPTQSLAGQKKVADSTVTKKNAEPKPLKKPATTTPHRDVQVSQAQERPPRRDTQAPPREPSSSTRATLNPEEHYRMIAVAAYYRAEKRGFIDGDPAQDWVDAEAEVDQRVANAR